MGSGGQGGLLHLPARPSALHPWRRAPPVSHPVASSPVSLFPPDLPPCSFEVGSEGSGRGRGGSAPAPHPAPLPVRRPRLPSSGRDHMADPPAAPRGLCGVTGGGFPASAACLPAPLQPLALDRSASANCWSSAALGSAARCQAPPHALRARGLLLNPLPHSSHGYLVQFSALSPLSLARGHASCRSPFLCPWWWGRREPGVGGPGG